MLEERCASLGRQPEQKADQGQPTVIVTQPPRNAPCYSLHIGDVRLHPDEVEIGDRDQRRRRESGPDVRRIDRRLLLRKLDRQHGREISLSLDVPAIDLGSFLWRLRVYGELLDLDVLQYRGQGVSDRLHLAIADDKDALHRPRALLAPN